MSNLSSVLRNRRKELGLTLAQIAEEMEVAEATVQRWESGNIKSIRYDKIGKLAEILHVSPASIMGWDDNPPSPPQNILPLKPAEIDHIQKYRRLTDNGRATVDNVIDGLLEAGQPAREQEPKEPEKILKQVAARGGTGEPLEATTDTARLLEETKEWRQEQIKKSDVF